MAFQLPKESRDYFKHLLKRSDGGARFDTLFDQYFFCLMVGLDLKTLGIGPGQHTVQVRAVNAKGGFPAAEAYAVHRPLIKVKGKDYDPFVLARIERGKEQDAADYIELQWLREEMIRRLNETTAPFDALLMPTVPIIAPALRDLGVGDAARIANAMLLRNPLLVNFFDRCAISLPCHKAGDAPVGLSLVGETGADRKLLSIAAAVEKLVSPARA